MAASNKLLLALSLSLFFSAAIGLRTPRLSDAQQCRIRRLTAVQPREHIQWEGGHVDRWDHNQEQFQCAGIAAMRVTLRPKTVHTPSFHPTPGLVYVLQGRGMFGLTIPGCAETYSSQETQPREQQQEQQGQDREGQEEREEYQRQKGAGQNQKVRNIRQGDVIAIPAGAAHWCANNDEQQNLVVLKINDLNHVANQLDERLRIFYLGGQQKGQGQEKRNMFQGLDQELVAEALGVPVDTVRKMTRDDDRGFIVKARQELGGIIRPRVQEEQQQQEQEQDNGLEETTCTMKIHTNIGRLSEADVYSRQAGRVSGVDRHKLPILRYLDLSMEKGELFPNALVSPHWTMNGHFIMYVIRGDAQVQAVNYNGENVMNDRVNQGDMVVVPQFFAATIKAGNNGFEWVAVKTTAAPMKSTLAGYTSVFRAQPLEVLTHSYQISPGDAQQLKLNRGGESVLLSSSQSRRPSLRGIFSNRLLL